MACIAVLIGSLAPTISHALQAGTPAGWAEICTALGAKLVPSDEASETQPGPVAPADHLFQHCPYCSLHTTAIGLPPTPSAMPTLSPQMFGVPERFLRAPHTLFAWTAAQARAPPRLS